MIRRILGWALTIAKRLVDDTIPEKDLHAFLRKNLMDLDARIKSGEVSIDDPALGTIYEGVDRLRRQGFSDLPDFKLATTSSALIKPEGMVRLAEPILHQGIIAIGPLEKTLLQMEQNVALDESQHQNMEALLRHIEIRRQGGLVFNGQSSNHDRWLAVAVLSALFSRYAAGECDYRFLNSALKLNDWAFRYFRKRQDQPGGLPYLRAVLELEATLLEMAS